jgi:hypothetical protein
MLSVVVPSVESVSFKNCKFFQINKTKILNISMNVFFFVADSRAN